jgi:hypothetical protein
MAAKKTSKAAKPTSKTAYVLGLPMEMSTAEVVAKAKAEGIELTPNYVSNIRSSAKTKGKAKRAAKKAAKVVAAKKATTSTPAKKVASKKPVAAAIPVAPPVTAATAPTATEFIASQPRDIPAAAVVKAAKKVGLTIAAGYVYKVRSRTAATAGEAPAAKPVGAAKAVATPKASATKKAQKAPKASATKKAPVVTSTVAAKATAEARGSNIEGNFKRLVVELGVARAFELVGEVRKTLAELFGAA